MPKRLVFFTLCSIFAIMVGAVLTVIGLARGPQFLAILGIAIAAISVALFIIEFIRTFKNR